MTDTTDTTDTVRDRCWHCLQPGAAYSDGYGLYHKPCLPELRRRAAETTGQTTIGGHEYHPEASAGQQGQAEETGWRQVALEYKAERDRARERVAELEREREGRSVFERADDLIRELTGRDDLLRDDEGEGREGAITPRDVAAFYIRRPDPSADTPWRHTGVRLEQCVSDSGVSWAVRMCGVCLNKSAEWEHEPSPSNRDDDFYDRCRWDDFDTAREAGRIAVEWLEPLKDSR